MNLDALCICTWRMVRGCPRHCPAGPESVQGQLDRINERLDEDEMSQAELNTDVQNLLGMVTTIQAAEQDNTAAVAAVQAEIAALQSANPELDLSELEAAINGSADGTTPGLAQAAAAVTAGVQAVQGLAPAAPATPPADGGSAS